MDGDAVWEYNAPQFVDFSRPMEEDVGVDRFFDIDHENENALNAAIQETELFGSNANGGELKHSELKATDQEQKYEASTEEVAKTNITAKPKAVTNFSEPISEDSTKTNDDVKGDFTANKMPSNVCSSVEQWKSKTSRKTRADAKISESTGTKQKPLEEAGVKSKRISQPEKKDGAAEEQVLDLRGRQVERKYLPRPRTRSLDRGKLTPAGLKARSSPGSTETLSRPLSAQRRAQSQERVNQPKTLPEDTKKSDVGKLTMPYTPSFMKREMKFLHSNPVQSSEVQEMEKIRELRRALADRRKMAAESRIKALSAVGYEPVRSKLPVTHPQEFNFASDARLKATATETGECKQMDFAAELRKHKAIVSAVPTVPQPFRLHPIRKRTLSGGEAYKSDGEKFETMAEKVIKFSYKTPDRFHTKPATERHQNAGKPSSDHVDFKLTVPKTPNLVARTRSRPIHFLSQVELEEQEIEEIRKNQFKAQPMNPKIFESSNIGIKKVKPKECTVPEAFAMESDTRVIQRKRHHSASTDEPQYEFHAQPVSKRILLGIVGVKPPKEIPLTVPQSPAFATKNIMRTKREEPEVEMEPVVIMKAQPVPHVGIPFQPKLDHRVTVLEPFSFEERNKELQMKKEEQIKKVLEEEKKAREFHAKPLKDLEPVLPDKKVKPPTTPEPFNLEIEARCNARIEGWKYKIDEESKKLKAAAAAFKAKPASVLEKEPFVPAKSAKPLTEANNIQLNTEKRAEKRHEWETWNNEKLTEIATECIQYEKIKEEENAREIQRLRNEAVPKANPIRQYKTVQILPSNLPLTDPESPRFSERLRSKILRH